jgi:hypothetical protein
MSTQKDELREKISGCGFFIVLSTKGYLKSLKKSDEKIMAQISMARELKKPFFIVEDSRMLQPDIEETRKYFSQDNVIGKISVNLDDKNSPELVANKIRDISRMFCPESRFVNLVTGYPDDEDK